MMEDSQTGTVELSVTESNPGTTVYSSNPSTVSSAPSSARTMASSNPPRPQHLTPGVQSTRTSDATDSQLSTNDRSYGTFPVINAYSARVTVKSTQFEQVISLLLALCLLPF